MSRLLSAEFGRLVAKCPCLPCGALRTSIAPPTAWLDPTKERSFRMGWLTSREKAVLALIGQGNSYAVIEQKLNIKHDYARNIVAHIFAQLGVHSRAEAALVAVQNGLVPAETGVVEIDLGAASTTLATLTDSDRVLLKLLAEGLSNKEIAQRTHRTVGTIKERLTPIYRKLCVADRTQAALLAVRMGVIRIKDRPMEDR